MFILKIHRNTTVILTLLMFHSLLETFVSFTEFNKSALTDQVNQENHTASGPRRQWLTESQIFSPGWSRRPYTSTRKVHKLWITMKAAINWVTHMTILLARQILVMSRTGRTNTSFFWWWRSL